jgi:hypothetical protein
MNSTEGSIERSIKGMVAAWSILWDLGAKVSGVLEQRSDTPDDEKWSGRWESNPQGRRFRRLKTSALARMPMPSVISV